MASIRDHHWKWILGAEMFDFSEQQGATIDLLNKMWEEYLTVTKEEVAALSAICC